MNKAEKVLMSYLIFMLVGTASFFGFFVGYYHVQVHTVSTVWHDIWIDTTDEIVANRTIFVGVSYRDEHKILFYWNNEVYRSESASETIQWTINHNEGKIFFDKGTYHITKTLIVDSHTELYGYPLWQTVFETEVFPVIQILPDAKEIVIQYLNVTDNIYID